MSSGLQSFLTKFEPIFFYVLFCLVLIIVVKQFRSIVLFIKKSFSRKEILIFMLSFILLVSFVGFVGPKTERIMYDEDIYINTAQNIITSGKNQYCVNGEFSYGTYKCSSTLLNKQLPGYPLTLSLFFRLVPVSRAAAFIFNNVVFAITLIFIFFTAFRATKNFPVSLFSLFLFSSVPIVIHWYNSAASEPVTALYSLLTLFTFLVFRDSKKLSIFFLGILFFILTIYTRYEMVLLIIPIFYSLLNTKGFFKNINRSILFKYSLTIIFSILFLSPILFHYLQVRKDTWGATDGNMFSLNFFIQNFNTNIKFFITNKQFPFLALFLLLGIFISKRSFKVEYFLLAFVATFTPYLFFYAGSYEYGADIRYALNSLSPFIVLCALGFYFLMEKFGEKNIFIFLGIPVIFNMTMFIPSMRVRGEEGWQALWDIDIIHNDIKNTVNEWDYVYTNTPYSYHIDGLSGQSTDTLYNKNLMENLLASPTKRKYYFHYGYWCSLAPTPGTVADFCQNYVLKNFELKPVLEKEKLDTHYALYEIVGVKR